MGQKYIKKYVYEIVLLISNTFLEFLKFNNTQESISLISFSYNIEIHFPHFFYLYIFHSISLTSIQYLQSHKKSLTKNIIIFKKSFQ
ncbi:MAG: hypothetical protein ACD_71C00170G0003 [uncultured bacterium (gcode 4)]|uniref:Uncharacterized protein n=1 Tax=uncultured bacterium (gcode 4) TaxID=1234023 RepID=K2A2V3_9BACT|nr:MAG: hypothetical protein ACD_71C00170G0003 [uncultured bacterium (gcode 4)]